ncbi:ribosomal protein S5 domain 2-type protein [Dimargaris cristalligena]|uniref:Ribosomal protein S5 domain 2-type protein n=1 Tax=Dimargaris cristalligena TaxID=215637 RepID=A0A4Q0A1T6_9FUNG|nr:ribosomal protein S5 domain 2-type protein [Dimargaris cristalligena]|eukprot:RKP39758.1 ribosomal protein S5 domain 2-type protein [Dimargaris cristalligena]
MTTTSIRPDGRQADQIRPLEIVQGLLHRPDGSAQFALDKTSTLAAVYGPMEIKIRDEKVDRATIEVNYKPLTGQSGVRDRWVEFNVRRTFEGVVLTALHPNTLIRIELQESRVHGSEISAAFNAATMALMDAGVPMRTIVGSVSCAIDDQGTLLLDPTEHEIETATSFHIFAFDSEMQGALFNDSIGSFTPEQYNACHEICRKSVSKIFSFMRTAVEKKLLTQVQQLQKE